MKKLSCRDLGGMCDAEIKGNTFEEMGENSRAHVIAQINEGDEAHKAAAGRMRTASPEEQQAMMEGFRKKFDEASDK